MFAIYVRVSTNYQKVNGFSIAQQIQKISNYLSIHFPDESNIEIYNDAGYSGTTIVRPGLQKLIRDIEDKKITCVIYTSTDRLSRSIVDYDTLLTLFLLHNIKFICIDNPIESANSMQLLKTKIDVMFAEYEAQRISERTIEGMKGALRKQFYAFGGKPPYGYRIKNKKLVIHRQESREVRHIFETFLNTDISLNSLVNHYKLHTKSKSSYRNIPHMLKNTLYCGYVIFHDERFSFNEAQIVSTDLFDSVQNKLSSRSKQVTNHYLFKDKLICAKCNKTLICSSTNKQKKTYLYYICNNKNCTDYRKRINEDKLITLFEKELNQLLELQEKNNLENNIDRINQKKKITALSKQINKYKKQQEMLFTLLAENSISKKEFLYQNQLLKKEIEFLNKEKVLMQKSLSSSKNSFLELNHKEKNNIIKYYFNPHSIKL